MKEASGELNMTVITIVGIGLIAAFFAGFLWPKIKEDITNSWDNISNTSHSAETDYSN